MSSELNSGAAVALDAFLRSQTESDEVYNSVLLNQVHGGIRHVASGGKRIRSLLVATAAGSHANQEAVDLFGACVDLLHGAFLIHDDILDRDDLRRGKLTIQASARDYLKHLGHDDADHLGTSTAIVAGDKAIMQVFEMLAHSDLDPTLIKDALKVISRAGNVTVSGEILDIGHLMRIDEKATTLEQVYLSNLLKTSDYTFTAPLKLGALAAGRNCESELIAMEEIGYELGMVFQAADDIAGVVGSTEDTGKEAAGDLLQGRVTMLTFRLQNKQDPSVEDIAQAVAQVVDECEIHLGKAREAIANANLPEDVTEGLYRVTKKIEGLVYTYVPR